MHIASEYTYGRSVRQKQAKPAQEGFELLLQKSHKEEEGKGKMVTVKEGGYLRQYIVRPDGSKILLSEMKQHDDGTDTSSAQRLKPLLQADGTNTNTKEALELLSLQAGAAGISSGTYWNMKLKSEI
ncbi:hypothetical protein AMS62_04635 [Bacillus sp. FJAT-18019]|nr:hypothetical protein AMS62_04635 [Bacillus sp. FJAT-18019]